MVQKNSFLKILYAAVGFLILSILVILIRVIPLVRVNVPQPYSHTTIIVESIVSGVYLLMIFGILWTIRTHKLGKRINKELLLACGVIPLVIGLIALDGVAAYWNKPETFPISIALLISTCLNTIACVLIFIARFHKRYHIR